MVNTLMTYLELEDVIEATAPFYTEYQFQPLRSSKEILSRFDAERAAFLKSVFACAAKARTWFSIDLDSTALKLQTTRDRLVKALTYLEDSGDLTLKVAGLRHGYRIKQRPKNPAALKRSLVERFETREGKDIERMNLVMQLVNSET
ncbi:MAG: RecQ family ATP-dependent DNA helicase, partial [Cytophagaceae bacterium]